MPSFLVETFVPGGDAERFAVDVRGIRAAAVASAGDPVRHLRSYLVQSDEMAFHLVEARTAEDVSRVAGRARVEVERIVPAIEMAPPDAGAQP